MQYKIYTRGDNPTEVKDLIYVPDYNGEPWLFKDMYQVLLMQDGVYSYPNCLMKEQKLSKTDPIGKMPELEGFLYSDGKYIVINDNKDSIQTNYQDRRDFECMTIGKYWIISWSQIHLKYLTPLPGYKAISSSDLIKNVDLLDLYKQNQGITYQSLGEEKYIELINLIK